MLVSIVVGWMCAGLVADGGAQAPAPTSIWQRVQYPPVTIPGTAGKQLRFIVGSGGHTHRPQEELSQLRLDVIWMQGLLAPSSETIANAKDIVVRLHTADGKIPAALPQDAFLGCSHTGVGFESQCALTGIFSWSHDAQAWFEVRVGGQTWWLELPYGFARNPEDPDVPDRFPSEPHFFPPATSPLGPHDFVVPWLAVEYVNDRI